MAEDNDVLINDLKRAGLYYEKSLADEKIPAEVIALVSANLASQYHVIPVEEVNGIVKVVTDDAATMQNQNALAAEIGKPVKIMFTEVINIRTALEVYYNISNYTNVRSGPASGEKDDIKNNPLQSEVEKVLQYGAKIGASDIHMKPFPGGIYVWMRANGKLIDETDRFHFTAEDGDTVANIIKNKDQSSNSDSSNKLMPNTGSFLLKHDGVNIRCRIATTPTGSATELTQKLDVRLMPQSQNRTTLEELYFDEDLQTIKTTLFKSSSGMFINAGPVGTGKTTALYANIDYLWKQAAEKKSVLHVYTIENPIEIKDERFTQVQVRETSDPANSLTPLVALDSALRSDPDVILFGEIRNSSEAQAAMKASQTGLKMFTTIHAGSCTKTILRLLNLGADQLSMLSELRFILTQRLIPQLCPYCSQPHTLTEDEIAILSKEELTYLKDSSSNLRERGSYEAQRNCPHCSGGIIKRLAVPEYIVFNNDIRDALLNQNDFHKVDEVLEKNNFVSMWKKALRSVHNGAAELNDVIRLIGKD